MNITNRHRILQIVNEELATQQQKVDNINSQHNMFYKECQQISSALPIAIQQKVQQMNSDWLKLKAIPTADVNMEGLMSDFLVVFGL